MAWGSCAGAVAVSSQRGLQASPLPYLWVRLAVDAAWAEGGQQLQAQTPEAWLDPLAMRSVHREAEFQAQYLGEATWVAGAVGVAGPTSVLPPNWPHLCSQLDMWCPAEAWARHLTRPLLPRQLPQREPQKLGRGNTVTDSIPAPVTTVCPNR